MNVKEWLIKNNLMKEDEEIESVEIEEPETETEPETEPETRDPDINAEKLTQKALLEKIDSLSKALEEQSKINGRILKQITPSKPLENLDEVFNCFDRYNTK